MTDAYNRLCTLFYDLTRSRAHAPEVAFYEQWLKPASGPFLEAMCGSGRLLLPLLERGYAVEGVDASPHMLESCKRRCEVLGLQTPLYHQLLQELALPKQYQCIFVTVGSFQLMWQREVALQALRCMRKALLPGGVLLLDTFVPWDSIKAAITGAEIAPSVTHPSRERKAYGDGYEIVLTTHCRSDIRQQLEKAVNSYEQRDAKGHLLATEQEELIVRWYSPYEMELLLEKAGFEHVRMHEERFEEQEVSVVYEARAR